MAAARAQQAQGTGPRSRILRVGILLGGKIVEERLIRERTSVTIGQSMKNTFSIPVEGLSSQRQTVPVTTKETASG